MTTIISIKEFCEHDFSVLHPTNKDWYFCYKCNNGFNKDGYEEGYAKGRAEARKEIFGWFEKIISNQFILSEGLRKKRFSEKELWKIKMLKELEGKLAAKKKELGV